MIIATKLSHHWKMPFPHFRCLYSQFLPLQIFLWPTILAAINPTDPSSAQQKTTPSPMSNELILNPEKLDLLLHNAAIFALLKAKAHSLTVLPSFPKADSLLYGRCALEAKTAVQLAKCVVPLLNAREGMRRKMVGNDFGNKNAEEEGGEVEMDLTSRFGHWLMEGLAKLGIGRSKGILGQKNRKEEKKRKWPLKNMKIRKIGSKMKEKDGFEWKEAKRKTMRRKYSTEETKEMVPRMRGLRIRKLGKSRMERRRMRRATVKIEPLEMIKRIFEPNARQAKRTEMAREKRQGNGMLGANGEPMDLLGGKNVPWFMEPVGQLMRMAKAMMEGKKLVGAKKKREEVEEEMKMKGRAKRAQKQRGNGQNGEEEKESNISKLRRIQRFYEMYEYCQRHLAEMGDANSRYLGQLMPSNSPPILFQMGHSQMDALADELQRVLANYSFHSFPILSPRLLSLFPDSAAKSANGGPSLLSPTMFSFHREGLFSLPTLFGMVSANEGDMLALLDLFMELSGASRVLDKILAEIEPKMGEIEGKLYPILMKLEQMESRWAQVQGALSRGQREELDARGYTLLDEGQFGQLYGRKRARQWTVANEAILEEDIRRMAQMDEREGRDGRGKRIGRSKRLADNSTEPEQLYSLRPFLYTNKLRQNAGVAVNGIVLSPRAFVTSLMNPNFMFLNVLSPSAFTPSILSPRAAVLTVLSPTAFTANILTPNTLWTEVLSPKFFHSNILSPRALAALILSPRTMLGEVLSPKLIEFRALNPGTFFAGVLTPNLLVPRVLSPANFGVTVLSPNILSPSIMSRGNFTVQVLSPSIMSDDVSAEQFWRGEWEKPKNTTTI